MATTATAFEDVSVATAHGNVHCRAAGDGPVLFLMHSVGRSSREFDAVAALLADRFRVVSWDMPTHGDSDRPVRRLSIADFGDLAVEIAGGIGGGDARGKPVIGGSSIGAAIAVAAASANPEAVAGLVAIELPMSRDTPWWDANWPMVEKMFGTAEEPREALAPRFRALTADLYEQMRDDRRKAGVDGMMETLWAGRDDASATVPRVRALRVPTLFVNGDKGVEPAAAARIAELNPAIDLCIVADSGHFPQTDEPGAVADAIRAKFGVAR